MAQHIVGHFEKVRALACGARVLVVGGVREGAGSRLTFHDASSHKTVATVEVASHVLGLALAGDAVAAACADGVVRLYKAASGEALREITAHAGAATAVAALSDGGRIATAGADGRMRVFAVASGERQHDWALSELPLRAVAADPTGETAAAAGDDGVVRVVTVASGEVRAMPGHEGPVRSLAYTPRDGRLVSGGDDGLVRIWFLVGDVESEVRGQGDDGHKGPVNALAFLPSPKAKPGEDQGDRFVSAGGDGKLKFWRLDDRRKPRTIDVQGGSEAAHAVVFFKHTKGEQLGLLFVGGDRRDLDAVSIDGAGPGEQRVDRSGYYALRDALNNGARPAREAAVREAAALSEPEALEMVVKALSGDRYPEVRELAARELGRHHRVKARAALQQALDAHAAPVRTAAYEALVALEPTGSVGAQRMALASNQVDLRLRALSDLVPRHRGSPLTAGLVAGALADGHAWVRLAALQAHLNLLDATSTESLELALASKQADLRAEALVRAALGGKLGHPRLAPLVAQALDDSDPGVRRTAFVLQVTAHPALAARLEARDEGFRRAERDVSRHAATVLLGLAARLASQTPDDVAIAAARHKLGAAAPADAPLGEEDLGPLLAAMACRTPDTAMRGARGLAELGDTRALGALLQLSREPDKAIRREATLALQTLDDPRAKKRVVWMLDDADADVRTAAFEAYQKLERDPLELAEAALRSSQKDIRVQGLSLLVKQADRRAAPHEALLGDALEDESADVRAEAFRTLWSWHSKTPRPALERALTARFADLRRRAVQELETLGKDEAQGGWARELLLATIQDRDEGVATAAFEALVKLRGKEDTSGPLAAMATAHGKLRAAGAKAARTVAVEPVRSALMKQLPDENAEARSEALAALDKLLPKEAGPLYAALQGSHVDLRVQAAELLADRGDEQIIDAMRALLADKELARSVPAGASIPQLRFRAARALATLASPRLLKYLATELLKDEDGNVREQAARGLSLASKKGDEGHLLDALGHNDVAVRSWAAEGLARLGDVRALPVLTGHLRHAHPPVRVGAILSFAALGPEGYGGMLQGLEDASREVQELVFLVILARDLRALRRGEGPDLLTSALSSQRAEVRYAAARAIELRGTPGRYLQHLIEALLPPKPDKAAAMKEWPDEQERGRRMVALAESLASDQPEVRYAAAQALRLRSHPLDYFRQAERLAKPRAASQAPVADTAPRKADDEAIWGAGGWLRRLFREGDGAAANDQVPDAEQQRLRWLAFGAYVGLLRQTGSDDEGGRVRRDTVERVVELSQQGVVSRAAALPALGRALDDGSYLVRKAAFAGLERLFPPGADEPLLMALASHADDVARAALDELARRGAGGRDALAQALQAPVASVRKHAFELLEGLYPKGSLEPLFLALQSDHADLRLGVLQRLAHTPDERVQGALVRALRSDHDDLRLMAAELLAQRKSDQAAEVLGGFLRHDSDDFKERARAGLARLGTELAVRVLAARLGESDQSDERSELLDALGRTRNPAALEAIVGRFADDDEEVRSNALTRALRLAAIDSRRRDEPLALRALVAATQARDPELRRRAARELARGEEVGQNAVLQGLFTDRDLDTRKAAVDSYGERVLKRGAPVEPLEAVMRRGARPTLLAAAEAVAMRGGVGALRPLLLFARAGEDAERPRALLALGSLGDERALGELETVAQGGTEEAPVSTEMRHAAIEALGRMVGKLRDPEVKRRVIERLELGIRDSNTDMQQASLRALRWVGDDRSRSLLEHILTDKSVRWDTKVEAAKMLSALRHPASEPALLEGLRDRDNDVRATSRRALMRLFPGERTRIELHALVSGHDDMAEPAAAYLAHHGEAELLLPKLSELRGSDSEALRQKLRLGLLRRPVIAASSLARLLSAHEPSTRQDAAWLIGSRVHTQPTSDADRQQLTSALRAADEAATAAWPAVAPERREAEQEAWATVLWALGALGHRESTVRLRTLTTAAEAVVPRAVRQVATQVLDQLGGGDEVPALQGALRDDDAGVRAAAAGALGHLAPALALKLAQTVDPFDPASFGRAAAGASEAAAEAAVESDAGRRLVLPRLIAAGRGAPLAARIAAARGQDLLDLIAAAGRAGGGEAIEALRALAFDKKQHEVAERKAAYRALRRAQRQAARASKQQKQQETRA